MTIWRVARAKPEVDFKEETGEKWRAQGESNSQSDSAWLPAAEDI